MPVNAIDSVRVTASAAFPPTGVTNTSTVLPVEPAGGAVSVNVARPSLAVTTSLCDSVPALDPRVTRWPLTGCPRSFRTIRVTTVCELPSRGSRSGDAERATVCASPEGPISDGASCSSIPQAVRPAATAARTAIRNMWARVLCITVLLIGVREITEIDAHRAGDVDVVARLVATVERHLGNRRDDVGIGAQVDERRFELRGVPHDLEAGLDGAVDRHGERHR